MIYDGVQHIKLAKLPSPEKLCELQTEGFNHLVNVSGIDLFQLYGAEGLHSFTVKQYSFKDVFSKSPQLGGGIIDFAEIGEHAYIAASTVEDRQSFYLAVIDVLENLKTQTPTFVFCHQGIGRSPCVLFAALAQWYEANYSQVFKVIKFLNAHAVITCLSCSAVKWFAEEFNRQSTP